MHAPCSLLELILSKLTIDIIRSAFYNRYLFKSNLKLILIISKQSQSTQSQNYSRTSTHNTRQIYDYFVEFHDISGNIYPQHQSNIPSMIKTYLVEHFDSIIFVFDLNNLKSLNSIRMFMKLLPLINQIDTRSSDSSIQITKEEQEQMNDWKNVQEKMRKVPILIVGNKQDLINQSKAQYLNPEYITSIQLTFNLKINVKVMKVIKELDSEKQCTYIESGISSLGSRYLNKDDIETYIQKLFGNILDSSSSNQQSYNSNDKDISFNKNINDFESGSNILHSGKKEFRDQDEHKEQIQSQIMQGQTGLFGSLRNKLSNMLFTNNQNEINTKASTIKSDLPI